MKRVFAGKMKDATEIIGRGGLFFEQIFFCHQVGPFW